MFKYKRRPKKFSENCAVSSFYCAKFKKPSHMLHQIKLEIFFVREIKATVLNMLCIFKICLLECL